MMFPLLALVFYLLCGLFLFIGLVLQSSQQAWDDARFMFFSRSWFSQSLAIAFHAGIALLLWPLILVLFLWTRWQK